ncbi:OmpH family outer membrane protein [Parahaliea mediterranea]|uniref:OmpH family outer membrane protein n=1 Tax=Parahaliea mediterranea TaxID=651086 RepID=A0A939DFX7_9GAMM|nr:OmpH family outer membrane protein [Parahaliea mediterranea]MBN7797528.1 OmpH family outer membrane protein [Parahaliea mediterranea]
MEITVSKLFKVAIATVALLLPLAGWAQGKIAVVNLEQAILQTDHAQKRLAAVRAQEDYKSDKAEYDKLKEEFDDLVKDFQKDAAVMSQEQQVAARQKLQSKQSDLEHVTGKLQNAEQAAGQALLQEMSPRVQEVLRELITTEGIGLLLQRQSVIHADAGYSITAKVTDKLNQLSAE